ncbi:hypothetical protein ACFWBS_50950 [Streptomyces mirabilis]|uniref:hypothetical protein n=1 Tax=Streptomyces TaxID=1883 RepID=UPI000BE31B07|nr:hypothetical protein [Streptomyces sp. OK228]
MIDRSTVLIAVAIATFLGGVEHLQKGLLAVELGVGIEAHRRVLQAQHLTGDVRVGAHALQVGGQGTHGDGEATSY